MATSDTNSARPILSADSSFGDEQTRAQGHGPKYHPYTYAEVRSRLAGQVQHIRSNVATLPDEYRGDRIVVQAKLHPNYLAATHHPRVLREDADLVMVGTRASRGTLRKRSGPDQEDMPTKTLLLAATTASLDRMGQLLTSTAPPETIADEFVRFESILLPGPERIERLHVDDEDPDEALVWEAVLHPAIDVNGLPSTAAAERITTKLETLVERLDGEMRRKYLRRVGTLTFVPIRLPRRGLNDLERFNPLRAVRPMPQMRRIPEKRIRSADLGGAAPEPPSARPPREHRIAVFDGGVDATHPLLAPFVSEGDLTSAPRVEQFVAHGTLVSSALLYGHIQPGRPLPTPPAYVDHFRVLPAPAEVDPADEPYWILDQIVDVLRDKPVRWPIVNLSLGPDDSAIDEDADINRFTAELDQLIADLGLTVTVAVGNEGQPTISSLGEDRVMAPADGVNVLAVGACDDLAPDEPTRAPYSCVGPGRPGLRVSPLGVAFGGSDAQHFIGADVGGGYQVNMGTSFAAPTAARGIATLLAPVPFSANLARGMAAHFATAPKKHDLPTIGYGRLRDDYRHLLDCAPGTVTVVVRDTIERGMTRAYPMPYPFSGLSGRVKARWTVSFISPTDPQDAVEYTQAGLEVVMRPNATAYTMSLKNSGKKPIDVDLRTDGKLIQTLASQGWALSLNPKTRSGKAVRSEHTLRDEGKWETVMRHEDGANADKLHLPSIWVTYYERAEGQLIPKATATSLDFTLVMTIESKKTLDLYEQVRADARFAVLTPLTAPIHAGT
ncbi:S8 family peptidase [Conexibacter sp. JD483]|uniref:S8 family peptidase n=1 Tax=unclassified Conexibacter TaxID=2627773 RepID=UPI00271CF284|nr:MULTISPECIES: S8 family peptidase [unclassified Conexibacter]MDO8187721.1 S8 family peptidase [Conexibacter sp. CPCC 205706]MDO8200224.1 S8 family peptidase [Conexibacter sp. CPCC 205762]MDR9369400.1 S8 family peptidase [Conexibacter sp. JD483]